jgi:hypothetical protein
MRQRHGRCTLDSCQLVAPPNFGSQGATTGSEAARNHLYDAERRGALRGLPAIRKPFGLSRVRRQRRNDTGARPLARIPDRFS